MSDPNPTEPLEPELGRLVVHGVGRVSLAPDLADLRLGVSITHPTVAGARADAAQRMEAILGAVAAAGVDRQGVRTSVLAVQPRYDYRDGAAPILTGYELSNMVEVTVRDLARLGEVVDGTLGAGATSMDGLTFRAADPRPAEREALLAAMAEARRRADVLAEAAGLVIERVMEVVEGDAARQPGPLHKAERMSLAADVATPVEGGALDVTVAVTVTYRAR